MPALHQPRSNEAESRLATELAEASSTYRYLDTCGETAPADAELAEEVALAIAFNGISQAVMLVSPADLEDFVVGFSLGSGIVDSIDDIYDIRLGGTGAARQAEVQISNRAFWRLKQQRRRLAGSSGCGLCGVEALEQALPSLPSLSPAPLPPLAWLHELRPRIAAWQPLGRHCGAVHAALFMDAQGELRLAREDIGRHNALDKLIGALLRQRQPLHGGLAIVTSRCSLELIHKVLRAGIHTLVSLSAPTGLAVQWARRHQLNLIHLPQRAQPRVYSPESAA
ncbi:formate dehydrogenase accessory sulfurtransferase FdhD [Zestomonas thermotolerans]|uniref:formate dehydrogenase accessory sulfurtransferase FdhD n=1 Tax=Zestomonas thermotolerans TaxID=157784 RepID=UPI0023F43576|nr:formate dehydrogenase accessory sulfurtransferase FdhD [Pseudomonas thermotolerans]MBO2511564.1 sulfurtransferase FdhD [Gammaproteobacteria bacterium]